MKPYHKKLKVGSGRDAQYIQVYAPDTSQIKNDPYLVFRAAMIQLATQSKFAPAKEDIIWRDEIWDNDVAIIRLYIEYIQDADKRKANGLG